MSSMENQDQQQHRGGAPVRRKSSVAFEETCVVVDRMPLSMIDREDGVRRKVSTPIIPSRETKKETDRPTLSRRMSLTRSLSPLIKTLPSPPTKLRFLPRRWSGSTPPAGALASPVSPSSPDEAAEVVEVRAEHERPTEWADSVTKRVGTTVRGQLEGELGYKGREASSSSSESEEGPDGRETPPAGTDGRNSTSSNLTAVEEDSPLLQGSGRSTSLQLPRPALQLQAAGTRGVTPPARRTPFASRNPSIAEDLHILSEVDENVDHGHPLVASSAPVSPVSPTERCRGVWLCSPPKLSSPPMPAAVTSISPAPPSSFQSFSCTPTPTRGRAPLAHSHSTTSITTSHTSHTGTSGSASASRKTKTRPLVVRSMSTGRLASEYDEHGRVICLSVHSDRVLGASLSGSTSPAQVLASSGSAGRPRRAPPARSYTANLLPGSSTPPFAAPRRTHTSSSFSTPSRS
ncbi:hypothetical protein IAT38_002432 [Cryptococcus sp. DSM 104549]